MKAFTTLSALVALVASASAQLMVNTPSGLTECEPSLITWTTDNNAPYILSIVPAGLTTPNLKSFPPQSGNAYTWLVDIAAGQAITFALKDSQGLTVYSGQSTIQAGSSTTCVNATVNEGTATSSSVGGVATGSSSPSSASSGSSGSSSTPSSGSSSKSSSGTSTGTAATQSQTKSGAAAPSGASVGVLGLAGVMGLIGAVLL